MWSKAKPPPKPYKHSPSSKRTVSVVQIDVTDDKSVDSAAVKVDATFGRLNVLVNNARVYSEKQPARDALRDSLAVNVVGSVSTTDAFPPLLRKSSKPWLVFVTSAMGSLTHSSDPKSRYYGLYANEYRASKAAVNMLMVQYAGKLGREGVMVLGADPGFCATNFTGNPDALKQ
jgi:NAD(P)-dependent dehydrogenase (short-subunit alcohol dehydrogenase family)